MGAVMSLTPAAITAGASRNSIEAIERIFLFMFFVSPKHLKVFCITSHCRAGCFYCLCKNCLQKLATPIIKILKAAFGVMVQVQTKLELRINKGLDLTDEEIEILNYFFGEYSEWKKLKSTQT